MKQLILALSAICLLYACENSVATKNDAAAAASAKIQKSEDITTRESGRVEPFVSKEGGFKILFPDKPTKRTQDVTSEIGQVKLTQFIYEKDKTQAWLVSYSDYPDQMMKLGNDKQLVKGIRYQVLQGIGGGLKHEEKIKLQDKYDGVAFSAHSKKRNMDVLYRIYLVENRVFQIGMFSSVGPFTEQDSSDFLGSFQLLNAKADSLKTEKLIQ